MTKQATYDRGRAPYATRPEDTRGRLHPERESETRTAFQRDRDRIIHSTAFRRMKHKTQVFVYHEGDHYRTRLTHSLEVAQIARSICRELGLDEDLAEALALAHDLGHPPFGHAGEDALDQAMAPYGGFDHNAQSLRVLTRLEQPYPEFDGLNLTWECLEGVVKHNGPLIGDGRGAAPSTVTDYIASHDLEIHSFAGPEAQVAAIADDVAYNNHDIDDGLRAHLFEVEDLADVPLVGKVFAEVARQYPDIARARLVHESVRRLIGAMVEDILAETRRRLGDANPGSAREVRELGRPVAGFSPQMAAHDKSLKAFLRDNMYRHYKVNRMASKARRVVADLFELYVAEPDCLPTPWRRHTEDAGNEAKARLVCDFIAGMTDRFALLEHQRLFDIRTI
ncbi:MAG: deoxyguanosinetriphosphate triphosphohydrolase [Sphingomonadales bacterium]